MLNRSIINALCLTALSLGMVACDTGKEGKDFTLRGFWTFETTVRSAECAEWDARVGEQEVGYRYVDQRGGITRMQIFNFMGVQGLLPGRWGERDEFNLSGSELTGPVSADFENRVKLEVADSNRLISSKDYRVKQGTCWVSYGVVMRKIADSEEERYAEIMAESKSIPMNTEVSGVLNDEGYQVYRFKVATDDWYGALIETNNTPAEDVWVAGVYGADRRMVLNSRGGDNDQISLCEDQGYDKEAENNQLCFDRKVIAGGTGTYFLVIYGVDGVPADPAFTARVLYEEDGENRCIPPDCQVVSQ
ncbi:MAG: hypothetical protein ACQES2_02065 [Pseudomonadota bacterium]